MSALYKYHFALVMLGPEKYHELIADRNIVLVVDAVVVAVRSLDYSLDTDYTVAADWEHTDLCSWRKGLWKTFGPVGCNPSYCPKCCKKLGCSMKTSFLLNTQN